MWAPNNSVQKRAREVLRSFDSHIALAESAARRPKCWFNRDWEEGYALLLPEFSAMKSVSRLLDVRAQIAMLEGRPQDAFRDLDTITRIGDHAGQEPTVIAGLVAEGIHWIRVSSLAARAYKSRDSATLAELKRAIEEVPTPNLKRECRGDLYSLLSLVELSQTEAGREKLGLKPDDVAPGEAIFPILLNPSRARIDIVKAHREYWAALDKSYPERLKSTEAARSKLYRALMAFPTAARVYGAFTNDEDPFPKRLENFRARKLQYVALHRILSQTTSATSISLGDLKSPFDGKPLKYRIEGRQIIIEVSGHQSEVSGPSHLRMPPDNALAKGQFSKNSD